MEWPRQLFSLLSNLKSFDTNYVRNFFDSKGTPWNLFFWNDRKLFLLQILFPCPFLEQQRIRRTRKKQGLLELKSSEINSEKRTLCFWKWMLQVKKFNSRFLVFTPRLLTLLVHWLFVFFATHDRSFVMTIRNRNPFFHSAYCEKQWHIYTLICL